MKHRLVAFILKFMSIDHTRHSFRFQELDFRLIQVEQN